MCVSPAVGPIIRARRVRGQERIFGCQEAMLDVCRDQPRNHLMLLRECSNLHCELRGRADFLRLKALTRLARSWVWGRWRVLPCGALVDSLLLPGHRPALTPQPSPRVSLRVKTALERHAHIQLPGTCHSWEETGCFWPGGEEQVTSWCRTGPVPPTPPGSGSRAGPRVCPLRSPRVLPTWWARGSPPGACSSAGARAPRRGDAGTKTGLQAEATQHGLLGDKCSAISLAVAFELITQRLQGGRGVRNAEHWPCHGFGVTDWPFI